MTEVFVVRNQLGHYWGKKKRWVDGTVAKRVMHVKHEDEGLNLLVELSAKDIELRGEVFPVELNDKGIPEVEPSEHRLEDEEDIAKKAEAAAEANEEPESSDGAAENADSAADSAAEEDSSTA